MLRHQATADVPQRHLKLFLSYLCVVTLWHVTVTWLLTRTLKSELLFTQVCLKEREICLLKYVQMQCKTYRFVMWEKQRQSHASSLVSAVLWCCSVPVHSVILKPTKCITVCGKDVRDSWVLCLSPYCRMAAQNLQKNGSETCWQWVFINSEGLEALIALAYSETIT